MAEGDRAPGLIEATIRWNVEGSNRNLATEKFINRSRLPIWVTRNGWQEVPFATFEPSIEPLATTEEAT